MAKVNKRLGKGTLGTSLVDIDDAAVPASHVRFVKAITLCNKTDADCHVTITIAGINVLYEYTIPGVAVGAENTRTIPFLDQVMEAGERIQGKAEAVDSIDFYISGREVDA